MKSIIPFILLLTPSRVKIFCYHLLGATIGENCYVGFSVLNAKRISIGDCVHIGHFNLLWRLKKLKMGSGSRISTFNWITGAKKGLFKLGDNSSISTFHFFDSSANINIGSNTIIAGRFSQFFSHGISANNLNDRRPITIGNWCYVGSAARFTPGSGLADHIFCGMGSVVTKQINENFILIAGSPARFKKKLSKDSLYFNRPYLPHAHHPPYYPTLL